MYKFTLYMFICMGLLTGVLGDNYSYFGLVVSSIASGFLFVLILVMIVVGAIWNDWFPRFQNKQGKIKVERIIRKKHESQESIIGSDLKHYNPSHGVSLPPSRQNTEGRRSELTKTKIMNTSMQPSEKADTWIQEVQPSSFEEKSKEMEFEDEEPFILVTELLPDTEHTTSKTANGELRTFVSRHSDTKAETFHTTEQIVTSLEKQSLTEVKSGGVVSTVEKQPLRVQSSGGIITSIEKRPLQIQNSKEFTTTIEKQTFQVQNSGGIITSVERQPIQVQSSGGIVTTIEKQPLQIQTSETIVTTNFEKQPLQRLSTLPNSKDAVMDLSDEEDDGQDAVTHDPAVFRRSVTGYGYADANMVLY
ncbi:hypothetical protein KUTeg_004300 [Tegillarca granosa]|uniref:Uncharacterized protein n=1 Tax=Tegillarca granosa TaxID=220873 RepID=A0ABQ9FPL7_TEGGR|nr:hypothetical protein KUTeg_004300 [Tegillarca granosa]